MSNHFFGKRLVVLVLAATTGLAGAVAAADWPDWRGPARNGTSGEKGLPERWSPSGANLSWKAPFGARSTPVVFGNHLYLQNSKGSEETLQERVVCLNADTGKLLWEYAFNVYMSDVPPHRIGWASPVVDTFNGNVYVFGVGGTLLGLSSAGKLLWERSLAEDFGLVTTHGGRTVSPIVDGGLVIVSGVTTGWGDQARAAHRFMAFDKRTGATVWVSSPGGRPFDTTYSPPIIGDINGKSLLIAGGGDGTIHALKTKTGQPVWKYVISKRGLNTGVVLKDTTAIVSHSEENLDSSEMGLLAAIDATAQGDIGKDKVKWAKTGFQGGFSSPVIDGDRIYQVDNGANLFAFDFASGKQLWTLNLGTIQKSSLVLADGKLYVGSENGRFFILRPGAESCQILDEDQMGTDTAPEAIIASVAVSQGRVFLVTTEALYCIGKKPAGDVGRGMNGSARTGNEVPTHIQVIPTELVLEPGQAVALRARLFNDNGFFLREEAATWSLEQLRGTIEGGRFTPAADISAQAGLVKATVGSVSGTARVRVVPKLPWEFTFDTSDTVPTHWINAGPKYAIRDLEGNKVLVKLADNAATKRARSYFGPALSGYTIEGDVRAIERRRQMGDAGVVAQRYGLVLFGNHQRMELESWQPETKRTVEVPFAWKADTWYRLKLRVDNEAGGKVRARGKAWPVGEAEPAAWQIERVDPIGNRQGSPGIYADATFEIFFDNLKVTPNR
ncbi:MAG: PQQ-binding-like beta-propeller repeat protein [Acidobacteriota bacterium]